MRKKILGLLLVFTFILLTNAKTIAETLIVPEGLNVPFTVDGTYSSKELQNDTKISAILVSDVFYNNNIIFRKGTRGYIYPSFVNKAGKFYNSGQISAESGYFADINGNEQVVSFHYETKGKKVIYGAGGFLSSSKNAVIGPGVLITGKTVGAIQLYLPDKNIKKVQDIPSNNNLNTTTTIVPLQTVNTNDSDLKTQQPRQYQSTTKSRPYLNNDSIDIDEY